MNIQKQSSIGRPGKWQRGSDSALPPGQGPLKELTEAVSRGSFVVLREARLAGANDPALAFRVGAKRLESMVMNWLPQVDRAECERFVVPFIRSGILVADLGRASRTLANQDSSHLERALDVARVASDLVGLAGSLAVLAVPQYSELGHKMVAFSWAADLASHAARGTQHVGQRIATWEQHESEKKGP